MTSYFNVTNPKGQTVSLTSSFAYTNLHLREGAVIPYQKNTNGYRTT